MKPLKLRHNEWKRTYNPLPRHLKYGKTYYIAFAGITDGFTFTLKKGRYIQCEWLDGTLSFQSLKWIRSVLNQPSYIHFVCEVEKEPSEE